MKQVQLPSGERVAALGLGTWRYGEDSALRPAEIRTIRRSLELGMTLIDTAEMYGEGASESLIGEALEGRRDEAFIVTKVYPHNASRKGAIAACERSLKRLRTDRIDLYLLHWRGSVPFAETIEAFQSLHRDGKIRHFGVSNLDLDDMREWWRTPGGERAAANQLLYNLTRRGIDFDLRPWLRDKRVPVIAYSPIEQARLLRDRRLVGFAARHGMTPAQAALAWMLAADDIIAIPKTGDPRRLEQNFAALEHPLSREQLAELDTLFPPPDEATALEML